MPSNRFKVLYYKGIVLKHRFFETATDVIKFAKDLNDDVTILEKDDLGYYHLTQLM